MSWAYQPIIVPVTGGGPATIYGIWGQSLGYGLLRSFILIAAAVFVWNF